MPDPAAKRPRRRDPIWDAVVDVCLINVDEITTTAKAMIGKCVKELKEVGATADEITKRAAVYRDRFDDADLTPPALTKHWPTLRESTRSQPFSHHG